MRKAIYPGSFDPVTYGHLDIIMRSAKIFDELIVAVLNNKTKTSLFSVEERVNIIKELVGDHKNVTVVSYDGLLVDACNTLGAHVIVRGLRAVTDFEYELQMAQTNRKLADSKVDTVFLTTDLRYAYLSSSTVKEVAYFGGDISEFVPGKVAELTYKKFEKKTVGEMILSKR
ncbi:MAG: pantetheine-phosphate adenylyltransferase [Lachnospiraceae bacterium]|nr:pantetheine-phosphate adenylyltransferase [Lachnospiraceae bacterium]